MRASKNKNPPIKTMREIIFLFGIYIYIYIYGLNDRDDIKLIEKKMGRRRVKI